MVYSYAGTGSISPVVGFDFGNISYSYTPSSVQEFIYVDLGPSLSATPTTIVDHGSIADPEVGEEDWGDLRFDKQTRFPFGVVRLASSTTFVVKKVYVGSGQIFELGEAFTRLQAPWIVEGTISLYGEGNVAFLYRYDASGQATVYGDAAPSRSTIYNGSGSLFSGSFTGEAKSTVYPEQPDYSDLVQVTADDINNDPNTTFTRTTYSTGGSGTGSLGGFNIGPHIRFGTNLSGFRSLRFYLDLVGVEEITVNAIKGNGSNGGEEPDGGEDLRILFTGFPYTLLVAENDTSFNTLNSVTVPVPEGARVQNSEITIYQANNSGYQFDHYGIQSIEYTAVGPGDQRKTLFNVYGDVILGVSLRTFGGGTLFSFSNTTSIRTFGYQGSGSLFNFGSKEETKTYSYNTSSIDFFTQRDYGFVYASTTEDNIDLGPLFPAGTDDFGVIDDWEYILENYTKYPFGLFHLQSQGKVNFTPNYNGGGTLFTFGEVFVFVPPVWDGEGVITISGQAGESFATQYYGSGTIATMSGAANVFSVNPDTETALFEFRGFTGYALAKSEEFDVSASIFGDAYTRLLPRYKGFGVISVENTESKVLIANAWETTGSLFGFIGAETPRTYSYNNSSIDYFTPIDLGSVALPASTPADPIALYTETDYGTLDLNYTGETGWMSTPDDRQDWQFILENYTKYPFGLFERFNGTARIIINLSHTTSFEDSGGDRLFSIRGEIEIAFPNVHSSEGGFKIFGAATSEKVAYDEEFTTLFDIGGFGSFSKSAAEEFTVEMGISGDAYITVTGNTVQDATIFITGASSEIRTRGYQGSGSIFSNGILSESVTKTFPLTPDYTAYLTLTATDLNNQTLTNVTPAVEYVTSGTGTGSGGGFNIDPYFKFGVSGTGASYSADGDRTVAFTLDLRNVEELTFNIIKGNGTNGGDTPECFNAATGSGDNLVYQINGGNETLLVSACETSFETLNSVTIPVSVADRIQNAVVTVHQSQHSGSTLDAWGFQSVQYVVNGVGDQRKTLFDITGELSALRASFAHLGSGDLFAIGGGTESKTSDEEFTTLFNISGASTEVRTRGYQGTGVISTLFGAAESFTASPDDLFSLFDFTGGITSIKSTFRETADGALFEITGEIPVSLLTFAEQPEVQARIFGAGAEAYVPNWNGRGRISTLSGAAESFTVNPRERELLFSITGSAEEAFSFGNYDADSAARIFGSIPKPPTLVFAESGFGTLSLSGEAGVVNIDVYGGFGTIFSKGVGGESLTRRIPAFQADLTLSGFAGKAVTFNPPDITTHLQITGESIVPIRSFAEVFTVRLATDGTARERFVSNHIGDGAIASRGIGGEAISRKLPAFQADMFVSGFAGQKTTVRETFFGSLFTFSGSSAPELLTFAEQPEVQIHIDGESTNSSTSTYIGTGRISTLSGAAESATFNPTERELLFSFGGGFSDIKIVKAETKQIEISIDVDTKTKFIPNWLVEGTIPVSGIAHTTRSIVHTGEGFISTLSGAAESFTYNPTEDTALFSFLGTASIRSAVSEVKTIHTSIFAEDVKVIVIKSFTGSGVIPVSGQKDERISRAYEGTGVISTLSGSAESFTVNPEDLFSLFNVLGVADTRPIKVFTKIGSGALFTSFTAGEARTISVPVNVPSQESKGLFKLEGTSPESFTIPYEGFGSLFSFEGLEERRTFAHETEGTVTVSGIASTPRTRNFAGSGSLFSFIEAESAVRFVPSTRTVLFDITGESVFRTSQAHEGTGSLFTTFTAGESRTYKLPEHLVPNITFKGAARIKNTFLYRGQANLQVSGSAQESFTQAVYEGNVNIKTSGEATQRFVATEESQGGTIKVRGEASVLLTNAFDTYTLFDINGIAKVNLSSTFAGSGTIFTFISGKEVQPDKGYQGSGTITLRGESADKKVSVAPERTYGWII